MARLPRLVFPGLPHHVTQRGNGRGKTFFEEADYALYLDLLKLRCQFTKYTNYVTPPTWSASPAWSFPVIPIT
jgi:REP element-mobilizing transposase RayT